MPQAGHQTLLACTDVQLRWMRLLGAKVWSYKTVSKRTIGSATYQSLPTEREENQLLLRSRVQATNRTAVHPAHLNCKFPRPVT